MSDPLAVIAGLPGVPEAVQEARTAVDRLYRHRVLRRRGPEVSAESALRGARASAALEGVDLELESVRRGEATDPVIQGALRISAEHGRLGGTWRSAPRQVLARLHTLAAAGSVPAERLGRPRSGPAEDDPLGLGAALGPEDTSVRMAALAELVLAAGAGKSTAPALVLAAIVHAELVVLRPFGSLDGVVARGAERLTLVEYGLDPKSLVAVEVGHRELGDGYAQALRDYLTGTSRGVAAWVRHCAEAVRLGAREATAICEALERG